MAVTGNQRPRTLAHTPACRIERCPCGQIHVSVGAVTLRLDPPVFDELFGAMAISARVLGRAPAISAAAEAIH